MLSLKYKRHRQNHASSLSPCVKIWSGAVDLVQSEAVVEISWVIVQTAVYRQVRPGQQAGELLGWGHLHQPLQVRETNNILRDCLIYQRERELENK